MTITHVSLNVTKVNLASYLWKRMGAVEAKSHAFQTSTQETLMNLSRTTSTISNTKTWCPDDCTKTRMTTQKTVV
jgi:hypothetical protein